MDEVEVGDRREPPQPVFESAQFEPGFEETGSLGALAGRDDDEHESTFDLGGVRTRYRRGRTSWGAVVGTLQRGRRPLVESTNGQRHAKGEGVAWLCRNKTADL